MALPKDLKEQNERLMQFKEDINKLAQYISKNYPEEVKGGGEAVEIAIRIMDKKKG